MQSIGAMAEIGEVSKKDLVRLQNCNSESTLGRNGYRVFFKASDPAEVEATLTRPSKPVSSW